jgi:hypothetical protein
MAVTRETLIQAKFREKGVFKSEPRARNFKIDLIRGR